MTQPYFLYRTAYLTFDDGTSENTARILDVLNQYGAKATFFVSGRSDPTFLLRMRDEGHAIGNHTMSHDYKKIYRSPEAFWEDFGAEGDYLESILGYRPGLMRFPGGSNTRRRPDDAYHHKTGHRTRLPLFRLERQCRRRGRPLCAKRSHCRQRP